MTPAILAVAASLNASSLQLPQCAGASSAPALDHVVMVVNDLERASAPFLEHGFRLKHGRLHANNLLNRHIKFRDGSSIELMTLQGSPGDALAQRYADLLAVGEGGVYVALTHRDIEGAQRIATTLGLGPHRSASGPWQFLGFAPSSPAAALFFSTGGARPNDADSLVSHQPKVNGLAEAWLEGGSELITLLEKLGARRCGAAVFAGLSGERLALNHGTLVIVPQRARMRPRVLGVIVQSEGAASVIRPHAQFWVRYQPPKRRQRPS